MKENLIDLQRSKMWKQKKNAFVKFWLRKFSELIIYDKSMWYFSNKKLAKQRVYMI